MFWLLATVLLLRARGEEYPNVAHGGGGAGRADAPGVSADTLLVRSPRSSPSLADVIGIDDAKSLLNEAVVLPSSMADNVAALFWRSDEQGAVLLAGPSGLGKRAAAEAAAAAAGAQILSLMATQVAGSGFCEAAAAAASAAGGPVVIIVESLELAPASSLEVRKCLRDWGRRANSSARLFVVATMSRDVGVLASTHLEPFGFIARLGMPTIAERTGFLLRLLADISRVDPRWASTLREAAPTLANLTTNFTFGEIDLIVRRAFLRSSANDKSVRDPVALHHFEKIISETYTHAADTFTEVRPVEVADTTSRPAVRVIVSDVSGVKAPDDHNRKRAKDIKDPMDSIFGWCNFWLPEPFQLPPVAWAMIIFGILAYFMARSTYQPYGHRKRRGDGSGSRNSLAGGIGTDAHSWPSFGSNLNDWYPGGSPPANFIPPPGMPHSSDSDGMPHAMPATPSTSSIAEPSSLPTAGKARSLGPSESKAS